MVCAALRQPRLQSSGSGAAAAYLTERSRPRNPGMARFLRAFGVTSVENELSFSSISHCLTRIMSYSFFVSTLFSLCVVIPLKLVPHPLFFFQDCVA